MNCTSKNRIFLFIAILGFGISSCAQNKKDIWSGTYIVKSPKTDSTESRILDTIIIQKTKDAVKDNLPTREQSDLERWTITNKDTVEARRFIYDLKEKENEYEEFGWTDLHMKGKINCLDASHFFICQTEPKTTVKFGKEESYYTPTGYFGIMLHYGVFDLEKIK